MITFISCGKYKQSYECMAKDMYTGAYFKSCLDYALKNSDRVFILSAKYGLLNLTDRIKPYNIRLPHCPKAYIRIWQSRVFKQLASANLSPDEEVLIIAGGEYAKPIREYFNNVREPFKGMPIGKRQHLMLKEETLCKNQSIQHYSSDS